MLLKPNMQRAGNLQGKNRLKRLSITGNFNGETDRNEEKIGFFTPQISRSNSQEHELPRKVSSDSDVFHERTGVVDSECDKILPLLFQQVCRKESSKQKTLLNELMAQRHAETTTRRAHLECVDFSKSRESTSFSACRSTPTKTTSIDTKCVKRVRFEPSEKSREYLTPYDVICELPKGLPSYWLGCTYKYLENTKQIEVTVRQTGVMPKAVSTKKSAKLMMQIVFAGRVYKTITLMKSKDDKTFRSHVVCINCKPESWGSPKQITFRINLRTCLIKTKCLSTWNLDLERIGNSKTATEWKRCSF